MRLIPHRTIRGEWSSAHPKGGIYIIHKMTFLQSVLLRKFTSNFIELLSSRDEARSEVPSSIFWLRSWL